MTLYLKHINVFYSKISVKYILDFFKFYLITNQQNTHSLMMYLFKLGSFGPP